MFRCAVPAVRQKGVRDMICADDEDDFATRTRWSVLLEARPTLNPKSRTFSGG